MNIERSDISARKRIHRCTCLRQQCANPIGKCSHNSDSYRWERSPSQQQHDEDGLLRWDGYMLVLTLWIIIAPGLRAFSAPFPCSDQCCCLVLSRVRLFATPWTCNSLSNSSVHGVSQARILEWVAIPFSRGSS